MPVEETPAPNCLGLSVTYREPAKSIDTGKTCGHSALLMETSCDFSSEDRWRLAAKENLLGSPCSPDARGA